MNKVKKPLTSRVTRMDHIQIAASEECEPAAREFYGSMLGMREVEKPGLLRGGCWFQCGDQQVHIGVERNFQPALKAHPAFAISGWEQLRQALEARQRPVVSDEALPGIRRFFTEDPWGNRVEVIDADVGQSHRRSSEKVIQEPTSHEPQPTAGKTALGDRRNLLILAIPGSLRAASTNAVLLDSAACLAPEGVEVVVYRGLGALPHFNPDLDNYLIHGPVPELRSQLRNSDGILFSTPEYAHGIPGALKNALDWVVGSGELYEKPVALFSTSSRATYAQASLTETLKVMTARLVSEALVTVPLLGRDLSKDSIVSDPELSRMIRSALMAFVSAINAGRPRASS